MPTRLLLALALVAGSAFALVQAGPAMAATSQFKGVNWADTRDNYNTGWVIPDGLAASDDYAQVYLAANDYVEAFESNLGANTVRLPINPPSVSSSWWSAYRGAVDAALADGMGSVLWAGLKTGDSYSMEAHNGSGLSNNNASAVTQIRWGWDY